MKIDEPVREKLEIILIASTCVVKTWQSNMQLLHIGCNKSEGYNCKL